MSDEMQPMRVIIADDEPLARQRLRDLLAHERHVALVAECRNGSTVEDVVKSTRPDLVLLDVQMPGVDGMRIAEMLQAMGDDGPVFVFVTGYAEHAVRAFDVRAADYLLKPYSADRLRLALERARELILARQADRLATLRATLRDELRGLLGPEPHEGRVAASRFAVTIGRRTVFVRGEQIERIAAEGNYVRLCTGRESYLLRATMNEMEQRLDRRQFVRVHRSSIVRMDRVREMRATAAGDTVVVLHDGTEVPVSARYRHRLEHP